LKGGSLKDKKIEGKTGLQVGRSIRY